VHHIKGVIAEEIQRTEVGSLIERPNGKEIIMGYSSKDYMKISKGLMKRQGGYWDSGYVKPATKVQRRNMNKRVRRSKNIPNGGAYKKLWGWFEWS
jgi:hypothetical protein